MDFGWHPYFDLLRAPYLGWKDVCVVPPGEQTHALEF